MSDITVLHHGFKINLRVGAIVRHGGRLLLVRDRGQDWWYLPGGRIKVGESSDQAIRRELLEEIGPGYRLGALIVCGENFFTFKGSRFHEVCFYFDATWLGGPLAPTAPEPNEEFAWMTPAEALAVVCQPAFMRNYFAASPTTTQMVIQRDPEATD